MKRLMKKRNVLRGVALTMLLLSPPVARSEITSQVLVPMQSTAQKAVPTPQIKPVATTANTYTVRPMTRTSAYNPVVAYPINGRGTASFSVSTTSEEPNYSCNHGFGAISTRPSINEDGVTETPTVVRRNLIPNPPDDDDPNIGHGGGMIPNPPDDDDDLPNPVGDGLGILLMLCAGAMVYKGRKKYVS